jgi:hypothetical protein
MLTPLPRNGRFTTDEALIEFTRGAFGEIVMSSPLSNNPGRSGGVIPTLNSINESVDLAHEIHNRVS